jgi:hypothetical protein
MNAAGKGTLMLATLKRFLARFLLLTRQFICSLHGHDSLLHFEQGRMSLLCSSCGHETPGWDVNGVPARREVAGSRTRLVRVPLVRQSRAA